MKIQNKLFLTLFGFSLVLVVMFPMLMKWSIDKGMVEYVNTKEIEALVPVLQLLTQEYNKNNNWLTMRNKHQKFRHIIAKQLQGSEFSIEDDKPARRQPQFRGPPPRRNQLQPASGASNAPQRNQPPPLRPHHLTTGDVHYALLDRDKILLAGKKLANLDYGSKDIIIDGNVVGYFLVSKRKSLTQGFEFEFIEQQKKYLWIIALFIMGLVALVTLPISRHMVEPITLITRGMHKLTQGDYQQRITLKRQDELGELSRDYNELAHTLSESETARKRWLADTSHELRTPIAILRGELEAMLDDVRPLTKANITSANDEVKHLQRLIDDLHQLASTDVGGMRYRKSSQNLSELLTAELDKYHSYLADAGIAFTLDVTTDNVAIYCDKTRLYQLFENIINNSIKYSKASCLKVTLSADIISDNPVAKLVFEDNGIGVSDDHLGNLFEYLYRVDDSRNRQFGGAGLGLSLCRQIVNAHQGEIWAEKSNLGGLAIIMILPLS